MKNILLIVLLNISLLTTAAAQNFEGTIVLSLDYVGDGIEMMKSMAPNQQTYQFRDGDMRMGMSGGMAAMMGGDFIRKGKEEQTYMLKPAQKKAYLIKAPKEATDEEVEKPDIERTGEYIDILGYKCEKVKIKSPAGAQLFWVTKDIAPKVSKSKSAKGPGSNSITEMFNELGGFPLKTQMVQEQMGMRFTIISEAIEVDTEAPDKSFFEIPKDYEVEEVDPKELMGGF